MKQTIHKLSFLLLTLFTAVSLTGCDEDAWFLSSSELCGDWRIVEVTGSYNCNYRPGDYCMTMGYPGSTSRFDDYYMIVDVKDYYYNSRYTLRLTRMSHFYSAGKEQNEP